MKLLTTLFLLATLIPGRAESARELLDQSGITGGLIVHLRCGDGQLAADLAAANETIVVHALDSDPANITATRALFRDHPAATRLSAELHTSDTFLPHATNLANLLIISGGSTNLSKNEALRILVPGGTLLTENDDGDWSMISKPKASKNVEWTHYQYDASNNMVGEDPGTGLPRQFQWTGKPLWTTSHENMASVNAMVSAKGRVFYIIDEGPRASIQLPADWQLVARDAHNGVILWKRPIEQWLTRYWPWKSGPAQMPRKLITTGGHVYTVLDINGPLLELDAVTGETRTTYENTTAAEEFIEIDGTLLVQVNPDPSNQAEIEAERRARRHFSYDGRNRVTLDHDKAKRIVAINRKTGEQLWERLEARILPLTLGAKDKDVVYHDGERLVCLDLDTGKEKWKSEPITGRLKTVAEEAPTTVLGDDVVFFAWNKHTTAVSRRDGKTLWDTAWPTNDYRSPVTLMLMDDLVWSMNITQARAPGTFIGRDPLSGEIRKQFDLPPFQGIGHHRCYKAKASGDFVLLSRSGVEYVDPSKGTDSYSEHHWIRGACLYGILPANGMLYSTPHACACYIKGKLNGFTAMTPGPTGPSPLARPGEGPTEKGPAYGNLSPGDFRGPGASDWPTYRGSVARDGRNATPVTGDLKQTWKAQIGGELSAPTVGAGLVFVAQKDRNTVLAFDAATGQPAWQYTAGGTVDSPPTLDKGRVYFGSADGSVYCLRAGDGELAWRTRAAPSERRVIAYGRVESAWPINGSVLVQGGSVYCCAGRSSFLDGGIRIAKIAADTGKILLTQNVYDLDNKGEQPPLEGSFDMEGALPDILSGDGGSVYMRHLRFGTEILDPQPQAPHLFSPTGYLDANWWHRTHWVYGANTKAGYGGWWQEGNKLPAGRIMVFDEDNVYCFGREFYAGMNSAQFGRGEKYILYGAEKREGPEPDWAAVNAERRRLGDLAIEWKKYRTTPIKWQGQIAFNVRAMALAGETLFTSGPYGDAIRSMDAHLGKKGVRLAATDTKTGEMTASWAIDTVPVFDGLAAANGSLYVTGKDGTLRSFGAEGTDLESKLGEPIELIEEELIESDEEYRKQTQEFLGNPQKGKGKGKGKGTQVYTPRPPLEGESLASDFTRVSGGKIVKSELGYRLGAKGREVALALHKIETPVTTKATWTVKMKVAPGFEDNSTYQNGFFAFGDGTADTDLVKCGIQFIQGTLRIVEGPTGNTGPKAKLTGDLAGTFELTATVDLATQEITLKSGNQTLTHKLERKLEEITHLGYVTWNAVTDFSTL